MKRNDPVTRRFLQHVLMRPGELLLLVRDGKTGRVITAPQEEHLWTYRAKAGIGRAAKNDWINILEVGPSYFQVVDRYREWHFGFDDYYDVYIWDFKPCQSAMAMYNAVVGELRMAWRIKHPRELYLHMKPLLQTMTREKTTMRTRMVKPGEQVETIWDDVMNENNEFKLFEVSDGKVVTHENTDPSEDPYMFYNEALAAEDAVLFPDEAIPGKKSFAFRTIKNGATRVESGQLPSSVQNIVTGMAAMEAGKDPWDAIDQGEDHIWGPYKLWDTALQQTYAARPSAHQQRILNRAGLHMVSKHQPVSERISQTHPQELMERDRSIGFKETFHACDLEPGSLEKYNQVQEMIDKILDGSSSGSTDWVYFIANILTELGLRADEDDYDMNTLAPWPHSFLGKDVVRTFIPMAMFFSSLDVAAPVTEFLKSAECKSFRSSQLFNPRERGKEIPDRRSRTSHYFRDKSFYKEFRKILQGRYYFADIYPMDWNIAVRPIIAKLYRGGAIEPAYVEPTPQIVPSVAMANTEPHRPGKLDMFIDHVDVTGYYTPQFPPGSVFPSEWPLLLPLARKFAGQQSAARFALLRIWSAPHFYPLMVGLQTREFTAFLDPAGRAWEWKFVPKDMPGSEISAHTTTSKRLEWVRGQVQGKVSSRGDLILVMGQDEADLLRLCTIVAFAVQTKPWLREIDLWKSFINVDLDVLEGLDPHWLD